MTPSNVVTGTGMHTFPDSDRGVTTERCHPNRGPLACGWSSWRCARWQRRTTGATNDGLGPPPPPETVKGDWKYGAGRNVKDTPDWIVIDGTRAVLIEVKQSGLFLDTKMWGGLVALRRDLKKTLGEAAQQLAVFEAALPRNGRRITRGQEFITTQTAHDPGCSLHQSMAS